MLTPPFYFSAVTHSFVFLKGSKHCSNNLFFLRYIGFYQTFALLRSATPLQEIIRN